MAIHFLNLPAISRGRGRNFGTDIVIKDNDSDTTPVNTGCPPDDKNGKLIVLEQLGEISRPGETDYWRVLLNPYRIYLIEVLGADSRKDVSGTVVTTDNLTLADPELVAVWNADRSERLGTYSDLARDGGNGRNSAVVDRARGPTGWHQFQVEGNGGTGTYHVKIRINNLCEGGRYPWFGGPDGYALDIPANTSTNRIMEPHHIDVGYRGTGGFLGDNWSWYFDKTPDEDWIKAELRAGYEYTLELWTPTDFPEQHQARDLKFLGIYGPDGVLIPNTATQTSGPRVSLVLQSQLVSRGIDQL